MYEIFIYIEIQKNHKMLILKLQYFPLGLWPQETFDEW